MAVLKNYKTIQDEVISLAGRDQADPVFRDLVKIWINNVYQETIALGPFSHHLDTMDIPLLNDGTIDYTYTKDVFSVMDAHVIFNQSVLPVDKKDIKEFNRIVRDGTSEKGDVPLFYFGMGLDPNTLRRKIRIWPPVITAITMTTDVYEIPPLLSADGDVPVIPPLFHNVLVFGPLGEFFLTDEDPRRQEYMAKQAVMMGSLKSMATDSEDDIIELAEGDLGGAYSSASHKGQPFPFKTPLG